MAPDIEMEEPPGRRAAADGPQERARAEARLGSDARGRPQGLGATGGPKKRKHSSPLEADLTIQIAEPSYAIRQPALT